MKPFRVVWIGLMLLFMGFWQCPGVSADIYFYVDKRGVYHFTNTPTTDKYRPYMRNRTGSFRGGAKGPAFNYHFSSDYDHLIVEAAGRHGVEFELVKSMIKVESDFQPKVVSPKGAMGLMQIMPSNLEVLGIADPFDPHENIMGGTRFFRQMLDRFNGETSLALAAYNAGPGAVERNGRRIPAITETRDYVHKVLHYYDYLAKKP